MRSARRQSKTSKSRWSQKRTKSWNRLHRLLILMMRIISILGHLRSWDVHLWTAATTSTIITRIRLAPSPKERALLVQTAPTKRSKRVSALPKTGGKNLRRSSMMKRGWPHFRVVVILKTTIARCPKDRNRPRRPPQTLRSMRMTPRVKTAVRR